MYTYQRICYYFYNSLLVILVYLINASYNKDFHIYEAIIVDLDSFLFTEAINSLNHIK